MIYSDLNGLDPTNTPLLYDLDSIYLSLSNIMNTKTGERLFLPDFGMDLDDIIFDLVDDATALEIERRTYEAISRWDSRVVINTGLSSITPNYDDNFYEVVLFFKIKGMGDQGFKYVGSFKK